MKNNIDFSFINDFSKWIKEESVNKDFNIKKNQRVYPRISKKLSSKIVVEDGCYKELTKDFIKRGGIILRAEGEMLMVEVHSGTFYINEKEVYF
jgi:hypothetical protein